MTPKLKPCPFCGGEAKHNDGGNSVYGRFWWRVGCTECSVILADREEWDGSHLRYPPMECVDRWNKRAGVAADDVTNLADYKADIMALHDETIAIIRNWVEART